jgi:hypothetical protein
VEFEEMAAEQNLCLETQRLLGGTSLKLAFRRQALNTWLETFLQAIFAQLFPSSSEKTFSIIFTMLLTPGDSPPLPSYYFI